MVTNVYRVGNTDQYLWSGVRIPVTLVNESVGENICVEHKRRGCGSKDNQF